MTNLSPVPKWYGPARWKSMSAIEKCIQQMAYLADVVEVRETSGPNDSPELREILAYVGGKPGDNYCAYSVAYCRKKAGLAIPKICGRVSEWPKYLMQTKKPKRGDVCYWLNKDGTGHMGIVLRVLLGFCHSIEANTGPDAKGNQRDGNGFHRRVRLAKVWTYLDGGTAWSDKA